MFYIFILILPLLLYALFAAAILFHLKRYAIKGDATPKIVTAFIFISLLLIAFIITAYLKVPWQDMNPAEELQSLFNAPPSIRIK